MHSTMTRARVRTTSVPDTVELVSWPSEGDLRERLAERGVPRLLLVAAGIAAPTVEDPLEDWVREPADAVEVLHRTATLRQRAGLRSQCPRIEDDRVVRGDHWVAVPRSQLPVVELLIDRMGAVVTTDELRAAYRSGDGGTSPAALKAMIRRLKRSLEQVGLVMTNIRDRGYLLVDRMADGLSSETPDRMPDGAVAGLAGADGVHLSDGARQTEKGTSLCRRCSSTGAADEMFL